MLGVKLCVVKELVETKGKISVKVRCSLRG